MKRPNVTLIDSILTRGVEDVFVKESLEKKLTSGEKLRVKFGIDPTGATIHLGRAIPLRKLRAFQELGHTAVLIVGDFTAQIGDPSDKLEKRPMLTREKIKENLKHYKTILGKIVDIEAAEFVYNSEWLGKLGFEDIAELAESFTVQQMSARRNFAERIEKGEEISLREFLYPLMQGYDSVAVKADIEIGGFDQLFNLKAGRIIQRHYGVPEQDVLTTKMLAGTDGRKMSTSWGNVINITDGPEDMYGKVMSLRDELIDQYFLLTTDVSLSDIEEMKNALREGQNPKDLKMRLAREIVAIYHGEEAAIKAEEGFINTFKKGGIPENTPEAMVSRGALLVDVLVENTVVSSKSDFRRLIQEGAITNLETGEKITDPMHVVTSDTTYKIGKMRFMKIRIG